jgi:hypothetical protein
MLFFLKWRVVSYIFLKEQQVNLHEHTKANDDGIYPMIIIDLLFPGMVFFEKKAKTFI